jgi:3-oxoacyl-[acyl-carrier protein] reductase
MKLKDKVAIITGSSANIGKATALLFAKEGAKVVVNARKSAEAGQAVVDEIKQNGGEAIFVQADLSQPDEVEKLFTATLEAFGTADILVNNAGAAHSKPFLEMTKDDWLHDFDDNLFNMVLCSQHAAKIMQEKGSGVILNTTSIRGLDHTGREGIMGYSAAKAAAISFTKTLAKELSPHIRVNAVAPGFVITPNYDKTPQNVKDEFIGGTQIKRWIQPVEIAEAFLYLATAEAVTGLNMVVDGGFTLK